MFFHVLISDRNMFLMLLFSHRCFTTMAKRQSATQQFCYCRGRARWIRISGGVDRRHRDPLRRGRRRSGDGVQRLAQRTPVPRTSEQDRTRTQVRYDQRWRGTASSCQWSTGRGHLPGQIRYVAFSTSLGYNTIQYDLLKAATNVHTRKRFVNVTVVSSK